MKFLGNGLLIAKGYQSDGPPPPNKSPDLLSLRSPPAEAWQLLARPSGSPAGSDGSVVGKCHPQLVDGWETIGLL